MMESVGVYGFCGCTSKNKMKCDSRWEVTATAPPPPPAICSSLLFLVMRLKVEIRWEAGARFTGGRRLPTLGTISGSRLNSKLVLWRITVAGRIPGIGVRGELTPQRFSR
uniref:Heat shock protein family A (Hsp70) member 12A n=1 Tax=Myotis myotis TaxID=51298 RepID=A0A7J7TTB4_MYOMY|nr:heat shock protein family A (Hsp70) member 12A [Myotis myotis]